MKLYGETVEIRQSDITQDEMNPESKRLVVASHDRIKHLIDIIQNGSESEKEDAIVSLKEKIKALTDAKNLGLIIGIEKITQVEPVSFDDIKIKLEGLIEKVILGDSEAGEKLLEVTEQYNTYYREQSEFFSNKINRLKERFVTTLKEFSNDSGIEIDKDKVELITNRAKIFFVDEAYKRLGSNSGSQHVSNKIYINLDSITTFSDFESTFFHELLHMISHDYLNVIFIKDKAVDTQSSGVAFDGNFNDSRRGFVWLNEYFTEVFTLYMSKSEYKGVYNQEVTLINLLTDKGPFDFTSKLCKLYFRHIQKKEKQTTTPIQDWRNFSKEVDSVFGERFLVKLDIFIAEYGIDKAIEIIKNWEKGKPQIKELDLR